MGSIARLWIKVDTNYLTDSRILAAGDAWQLHFAAMLAAKALLTDGELTRLQLARIAPESLGDVGPAIDRLTEVGLFEDKGADTVRIHQWHGWNDPTAEVEAKAAGGALGNHKRWHVARGIVKAECSYCQSQSDSGTDR